MDALSKVGPTSNLNLNRKKKGKREENITFSPHFGRFGQWVWVRERKERKSSFSLRFTEIGWLEFVEQRFNVHLLDEGYAWVSTTHNFVEDFVFGEES